MPSPSLRDPLSSHVPWNDMGYGEFAWCMAGRGKYRLRTMPDVILEDPAYFYWARWSEEFADNALRQAQLVAARACHILPPKSAGKGRFHFEFDQKGCLRGISIGRKAPSSGGATVVRRKHLNLTIVRQLEENGDSRGIRLLRGFVMETYFNGTQKLNPRRAEVFFENDEHFSLTCKQQHLLPSSAK